MATTPQMEPAPRRPSGIATVLGWLGLALMIFPVGFPMYAAIGLVGIGLAWGIFFGAYVLLLIVAIMSVRRRPLLSFAVPFVASGLFFVLCEVVELFEPAA